MTTLAESEKAFRRAVAAAPKHTSTPWQYSMNVGPTKALIVEQDGSMIMELRHNSSHRFSDNVAFIVRACNVHDDLLAALDAIVRATYGHADFGMAMQANSIARTAIAKATA